MIFPGHYKSRSTKHTYLAWFTFLVLITNTTHSNSNESTISPELSTISIEQTAKNGVVINTLFSLDSRKTHSENNIYSLRIINQTTGKPLASKIKRLKRNIARTGIILIPDENVNQQKKAVEMVKQLLVLRPEKELISLYVFTNRLHLIADFTNDRSKLLTALKNTEKIKLKNTGQYTPSDLYDFKKMLNLSLGETHYFRNTFIVGAKQISQPLSKAVNGLTPWPVIAINTDIAKQSSEAIARTTSKKIDQHLSSTFYQIAFCTPEFKSDLAIEFNRSIFPIQLGEKQQKRHSACELEKIIHEHTFVPSKIYFEFDKQQHSIFQKAVKKKYRSNFSLSVKSSLDGISHPSIAHLRGQSSLRLCDRKSYSLELTHGFPKNLVPHSTSSHYFLMALCFDPMNIRSHTAYELWQSLGLFPIRYRFIELFINQVSQGMYMIVENPSKSLTKEQGQITSIIRRNFDSALEATHPNVKYFSSTKTQALGDYVNAFLDIDRLSENELTTRLEKVIDLDQYITHLATSAILRNGDFVDELLFIRQSTITNDGHLISRYKISKWDPDELFRDCHIAGKLALKDPWKLAYCVESEMGKAILNKPKLYNRFVNKMDELLTHKLSDQQVLAALNKTAKLVIESLNSKGVLLNISELQNDSKPLIHAEKATELVHKKVQDIFELYQQQRTDIITKIAKYRKYQQHKKTTG